MIQALNIQGTGDLNGELPENDLDGATANVTEGLRTSHSSENHRLQIPLSLRVLYGLYASTFKIPQLALLSIVNTRVAIPPQYLPAYGAIAFLPCSLRPILAYLSSKLLTSKLFGSFDGGLSGTASRRERHELLLAIAWALGSFTFVGTAFIPSGAVVQCFFWGFARGTATAWIDFLLGMAIVEMSQRESQSNRTFSSQSNENRNRASIADAVDKGEGTPYEELIAVFTAQSRTANSTGSFVSSVATFLFFMFRNELSQEVVSGLLFATAGLWAFGIFVSLKYQQHVESTILLYHDSSDLGTLSLSTSNPSTTQPVSVEASTALSNPRKKQRKARGAGQQSYDALDTNEDLDEGGNEIEKDGIFLASDSLSSSSSSSSNSFQASAPGAAGPSQPGGEEEQRNGSVQMETFALVLFQLLLAVSTLQKPIASVSSHIVWVSLVAFVAIVLVITLVFGYRQKQAQEENENCPSGLHSREHTCDRKANRIPHGRLNLYFLLRHCLPIAGFLFYSFKYSAFQSEPLFLEFLSILEAATAAGANSFYERFLTPYNTGWALIRLIAVLDVLTGLAAMTDVLVIRAVNARLIPADNTSEEDDSGSSFNVAIDNRLRCLVIAVDLFTYFFGEIDYMPSIILSTTNLVSENDRKEYQERRRKLAHSSSENDQEHGSISTPLRDEDDALVVQVPSDSSSFPMFDVGMQYASFLSCIDFGAQIGSWLSIPIIAALDITRENNWKHLDTFVMICALSRVIRPLFLCIILPQKPLPTVPLQPYRDLNPIA